MGSTIEKFKQKLAIITKRQLPDGRKPSVNDSRLLESSAVRRNVNARPAGISATAPGSSSTASLPGKPGADDVRTDQALMAPNIGIPVPKLGQAVGDSAASPCAPLKSSAPTPGADDVRTDHAWMAPNIGVTYTELRVHGSPSTKTLPARADAGLPSNCDYQSSYERLMNAYWGSFDRSYRQPSGETSFKTEAFRLLKIRAREVVETKIAWKERPWKVARGSIALAPCVSSGFNVVGNIRSSEYAKVFADEFVEWFADSGGPAWGALHHQELALLAAGLFTATARVEMPIVRTFLGALKDHPEVTPTLHCNVYNENGNFLGKTTMYELPHRDGRFGSCNWDHWRRLINANND